MSKAKRMLIVSMAALGLVACGPTGGEGGGSGTSGSATSGGTAGGTGSGSGTGGSGSSGTSGTATGGSGGTGGSATGGQTEVRTDYVKVVISSGFMCGLTDAGTLNCTKYEGPEDFEQSILDFEASSTNDYWCALLEDQTLRCKSAESDAPSGEFKSIAVGESQMCAIRVDGTLECTGDAEVPEGKFRQISRNGSVTCAIHEDGIGKCWNWRYPAEEGLVTFGKVKNLAPAPRLEDSCAVHEDGSVECGRRPVFAGPTGTFQKIEMADEYACGLTEAGRVVCWGYGSGVARTPESMSFTDIELGLTGAGYGCALGEDGSITCWNLLYPERNAGLGLRELEVEHDDGQDYYPSSHFVGTYDRLQSGCALTDRPDISNNAACFCGAADQLPTGRYKDVAEGKGYTCAILEDGTVDCWFDDIDGDGELDDNIHAERKRIADIPSGQFKEIDASRWGVCAISEADEVTCWGGTKDEPLVTPKGKISRISVGTGLLCAISASGEIVCKGREGSNIDPLPTGSFKDLDIKDFGLGACAVAEDGSITCWDSDALEKQVPPGTFREVTVGERDDRDYACALDTDDRVHCWGGAVDEFESPSAKFSTIDGAQGIGKKMGRVLNFGLGGGDVAAVVPPKTPCR